MTDAAFVVNSLLLGVGLAMDAFSASLANGLHEPRMHTGKMFGIAGVFAFFQAAMPLLGWLFVHTLIQYFHAVQSVVPWVALVLLLGIGGKMIYETLKHGESEEEKPGVGLAALLVQGIATSIDALSVGFTIAEYELPRTLLCVGIIGAVTFGICLAGVEMGKKFGTRFAGKAQLLGGGILILIGLEIFLTGVL